MDSIQNNLKPEIKEETEEEKIDIGISGKGRRGKGMHRLGEEGTRVSHKHH